MDTFDRDATLDATYNGHELRECEVCRAPTTEVPCHCPACTSLRASRSAPRWIPYGDGMRPAWHVPLTPEHAALVAALSAVAHAHPLESTNQLTDTRARVAWERLVAP